MGHHALPVELKKIVSKLSKLRKSATSIDVFQWCPNAKQFDLNAFLFFSQKDSLAFYIKKLWSFSSFCWILLWQFFPFFLQLEIFMHQLGKKKTRYFLAVGMGPYFSPKLRQNGTLLHHLLMASSLTYQQYNTVVSTRVSSGNLTDCVSNPVLEQLWSARLYCCHL